MTIRHTCRCIEHGRNRWPTADTPAPMPSRQSSNFAELLALGLPGVRQRSHVHAPKKIVRCDGSCARCDSDQCALPMGHRDLSVCYCSDCLQYELDDAALQLSAVNGCIGEPWTICAEFNGADFAAVGSYSLNSFWMQASACLSQFLAGLAAFFYLRPHGSKALRRQPGATGK